MILKHRKPPRRHLDVVKFFYGDDQIRVTLIDNEPWFFVRDVCIILREHPGRAVFRLHAEDRMRITQSSPGTPAEQIDRADSLWLASEIGAWQLLLDTCVTDRRMEFKRWFSRQLLPAVRQMSIPSVDSADLPSRQGRIKIGVTDRAKRAPHALYRCFGANGELLYVGISWRLPSRMSEHGKSQTWWHEVSNVQVETFPDRTAAQAAEAAAIRSERPRYNVMLNAS